MEEKIEEFNSDTVDEELNITVALTFKYFVVEYLNFKNEGPISDELYTLDYINEKGLTTDFILWMTLHVCKLIYEPKNVHKTDLKRTLRKFEKNVLYQRKFASN